LDIPIGWVIGREVKAKAVHEVEAKIEEQVEENELLLYVPMLLKLVEILPQERQRAMDFQE
jgi:hypothetical protein